MGNLKKVRDDRLNLKISTMSVLYSSDAGFFISHDQFINNCYSNLSEDSMEVRYKVKKELFKIITPYKSNNMPTKLRKRKLQNDYEEDRTSEIMQKEITHVEQQYETLKKELAEKLLLNTKQETVRLKNIEAASVAQNIYEQTGKNPIIDTCGGNGAKHIVTAIQGSKYLFPQDCRFYCKDVSDINQHLIDEKYDFIVLDPPWWNKFVRRKKRKTEHGYKMMYCEDLKNIPIGNLLSDTGLVAVWCTNSQQHMNSLLNDIFPIWNVHVVAKLFWLKVTTSGELVCPFAPPNGKQPFEQIVLARKSCEKVDSLDGKIVISVPSALHSHKPPLEELLKSYLPKPRKCLEIFARYLLPNWTSYGLEVLRFQHLSLYDEINKISEDTQN